MPDTAYRTDGTPGPVAPINDREHRLLSRAAHAAPSVHDSQPWRFPLHGHQIEVWADDRRAHASTDPQGRQMVISCGAALLNLRLAMAHLGFEPRVTLCPAGEAESHLATVERGPARPPTPHMEALYEAIAERRPNRGPHRPEPVPRAVVYRLRRAAREEGAVLHEIRTREQRALLLDALRHAVGVRLTDRVWRAEFLSWAGTGGGQDREGDENLLAGRRERGSKPATNDGVAGALTDSEEEALADIVGRETFFLLATAEDDRPSWLRAGMAAQRVLLTAHLAGVTVSFLNQPVEAAVLRGLVRPVLDLPGVTQLLLRVGYPWTLTPPAPRRSSEGVVAARNG